MAFSAKDFVKHLGGKVLSVAPVKVQTYVKELVELMFWRQNLRKNDGQFYNAHMEYNFTTLFGLTKEDYRGKRVLDIGCGPIGTLEWCDVAEERVGADPLARQYVELNQGRHKMRYVEAGSEKLPYPSDYFDRVSIFNALDHVQNVPAAALEAVRVLRNGGELLLIVEVGHPPTLTEPHYLDDTVTDLFNGCEVIDRKVFDINANHDVYASIMQARPRTSPTAPAIICARLRKRVAADQSVVDSGAPSRQLRSNAL